MQFYYNSPGGAVSTMAIIAVPWDQADVINAFV